MTTEESPAGDQPWSRTGPARVTRALLLHGVFGSIIRSYARVEVAGLEALDGLGGPAIFVANHCSHVDTPVLLRALPARRRRRTAVAAAADYFYANRALAGAVSLAFGTVPVERRGSALGIDGAGHGIDGAPHGIDGAPHGIDGAGHGMDGAPHLRHLLGTGWNLVLFAEGTRSRDGRVGQLRGGAVVLAARCRVPIVPVHIGGTHEAMPIGRRWMARPDGGGRWGRHALSVTFGSPIEVEPLDDRGAVLERVRGFMQSCGAELVPEPAPKAQAAPRADARPPAAHPA